MTIHIGNKAITVATLAQASAAIEATRGSQTGQQWYRRVGSLDGAAVRDEDGRVIARVSYNGRVWPERLADAKVPSQPTPTDRRRPR